ncbi:tissue alpha-L-fucosidase [Microdochium trichocladiopsis]|uniref:alpha-L-fucosidase n=1 Tax=Microdochium trichocladiopsis TaxID=1682393 RepID=A0A9P9BL26_9PEZI|nr:tissue alpha-L-fucosidase [Microdochium trichocladiopsis]KAH7024459.1 tissue alpha-L-fucosidase [Microdochium trichocladiopsis]
MRMLGGSQGLYGLSLSGLMLALQCTAADAAHTQGKSVPLNLAPYFNNKGFGSQPGEAAFDTQNQSFPVPPASMSPWYTSADTGIRYSFPGYTGPAEQPDNLIATGQTIPVCKGSYFSASFLIAGDVQGATVSGPVSFVYSDNMQSEYEIRSLNWYSWLTIDRGEITLPHRYTSNGTNGNTTQIFERTAPLLPGKKLTSIVLPDRSNSTTGRLHVFAISLWQQEPTVKVQSVRPTQKWVGDRNQTQVVEVTINNAGSECSAGDGFNVTLAGDGFITTLPGHVKRLCPGDQKTVAVGVEGASGGPMSVTVHLTQGSHDWTTSSFDDVEIGFKDWTADSTSLAQHESPDWFNGAKYGIFIHWGVYAVTGWGNSTPYESYAEWFWWYSMNHPQADRSNFYGYRLETYGKDWAYDDAIPEFTAAAWDPKEWVDLFADAGAQYFVVTTKHHDGFALFDTGDTSNRSSLHYGPKRDLIAELFDAAKTHQPSLKRGTYFSLPEWFNPDFGPYGYVQHPTPSSTSWLGIQAKNPYTGVEEPYTGRVPIGDFIADLMVPQMETLAYTYGTDIMWCDAGAANGTAAFAAAWYNKARAEGREVTMNSRCGIPEADFDTPEYETFASPQRHKWESNQGMDPYSYGYNRATKDEEYMNATTIVHSLVDMVSKNGNLLLDIGPRADGSIVQAEVDNLREAGRWIKSHGEAIFNTTYWFVQSEIVGGPDVRFTQTAEAFYIVFLEKPRPVDGWVVIQAPIPIVDGDIVSLLTVQGGETLEWSMTSSEGQPELKVKVDQILVGADQYGWVFKVLYVG